MDGIPWVAQRVCPIPTHPLGLAWSRRSIRFCSLPFVLTVKSLSLSTSVTPAESYPRYSSLESPWSKNGKASSLPENAVIPHIKIPP